MAEKKKYNSILVSGRKDETLTYSKYVKDEESGESVKESLDKKVNVTDELTTQQIKDGAITNEKMAADSVGNTNLQDGSVSNEKLEDGSITNEKLAENSITKDKLKDNTIGVEKLDPELRQTIDAATGLPKDLVETIQNVDETLKDHQKQLDDKQQQITANDEDISLLQTRSNQMEETIKSIAATGGASQATAVTYNNEKSKLTAVNIQSAVDEVVDKASIKDEEGNVQDTPFRVIENEEFIKAVVDSEGRLLFGIYRESGKPYYPQNDMYHISQSEEFLWVILDTANHPLLGIQQDGTCWAAKAQWLDDIKAIKEALSSIDENLKTFQPKEDGKGLINLDVAGSFFYISNDEYIIAVVDAENRILTGIKYDGEPYFPNHEMYSVITNEEWLYAIIDAENKVLGGFRADDGHMVVGGIDISTFIANAIIGITDIKERTAHLSEIENEEYLEVETDAEGKILSSTNVDGSHYIHNVKSETIENKVDKEKSKSLIDSCFADANTVVEDPEDRMDIKTDEEGKIISFRDKEGTIHEKKAVIEKTVTEEVVAGKVSSDDLNNIYKESTNETIYLDKPAFIELWFTGELPTDLSDERKPTSLRCKFKKEGIVIFECNCTLSIQGHGSTNYAKKGYTFEPYNENGKALSIKFGDMIATDSFQLKAYATDTLHCRDLGGYALWHDMIEHLDYPYNKFNNIPLTLEQEYNKDAINIEDAFYAPKGFNCACYINEEFLGLYTLKLKKTRQNYAMFKNNKKQIFLDTYNYKGYFNKGFSADGWEVKNPKIKGYEAGGEISDTEVLNSITRFFDFTKDFGTQKANVDEFMVLPHWLVFIIFEEILHSKDINGNNYNVLTWDGLHWSIIPWDIDITLGLDAWNHLVKTDDAYFQGSVFIGDILKDMRAEYESQIKELYTKWRNEGFLSVLNISKYFKKQIISVPRYVYEKDYQKWGTIWTNGNPSYEQLVDAISRRLKWLDTQWLNK
jgi:hypothetical protein